MYIILILHIPHASHMVFKIIYHLSCTHTVWSGGGLNTLFFSHHSKQTSILYFTQTLSYFEAHDSNLCQVLSLFLLQLLIDSPVQLPSVSDNLVTQFIVYLQHYSVTIFKSTSTVFPFLLLFSFFSVFIFI